MELLIGLALLNGVLIGLSRVINGRLGLRIGALPTAFWSHAVGFAVLSVPLALLAPATFAPAADIPGWAWTGGLLGVAFVALNSHVVPKLGASLSTSLVVAAQMLASVALDQIARPLSGTPLLAIAGTALIITGVWLSANPGKADAGAPGERT